MNANKITLVRSDLDGYVNIPVNMTWDFLGRDDSVDDYETTMLKEVIGTANDFEIAANVLSFASIADITGISGIAEAFTKPTCQDVIPFPDVPGQLGLAE